MSQPPPLPETFVQRPPLPVVEAEVPWHDPSFLPPAPPTVAYGYVDADGWRPCSREELEAHLAADAGGKIGVVWTPEYPTVVPPAEVPYLHDAVRIRQRKIAWVKLKKTMVSGAFWSFIFAQPILSGGPQKTLALVILTALVIIPMALQGYRLARARSLNSRRLANLGDLTRFSMWLSTREPRFTKLVAGAIILVALGQLTFHFSNLQAERSSLDAIALIEERVRAGEWWRLLTAILAHVNVVHFGFNFFALLALGRQVEALANWVFIPVVFLFSGVTGCLASLVFMENTVSVGASGGIVGFIGFLAVLEFYHRRRLPRGLLGEMLGNIGLLAVIGVVGFQIIDNAGHLGGLLAGVALGLLLLSRHDRRLPLRPPGYLKLLAGICLGIIGLTAIMSVALIWR